MGINIEKDDVVLVAGLLAPSAAAMEGLIRELEKLWGPVGHKSDLLDFDFTDYYAREIGPDLKRQFIAFGTPVRPETLRESKIASNDLEARLSVEGRRRVNVDPGYLDLSKLVVASTKDATYRVYLGEGVYAQSMLWYEKGSYRPWPWTYADYRTEVAISFFNKVRMDYKGELESGNR
ncbi:MAG: DUF4416 family protein [bacterium]